jgi:MFS transporter, DHA1 family, tetracycline resistance protein
MKELHIGSLPFIKVSAKKISEEKLVIVGSLILGTNFILFVSNNIVSVGGAVIPFVVGNGLMWPSFMSILSRRWIKASRSSTGRCGSFGDLASIVGIFLGRFSYNSIGDFTFLIRTGVILVIFVMSFQLLKEKDT